MTREEAIEILENGGWWDLLIPVTTIEGRIEDDKLHEALDLAIAALRPVSREQVEKMYPGCHKCRTCDSCAYRYLEAEKDPCYSCNTDIYSNYKPEPGRIFCPTCGSPLTEEAMEITMKRLEALKDGSTTD